MRWFGVGDINLNEADNSFKLLGWPQEEEERTIRHGIPSCLLAGVCVCVCPLVSASVAHH